MIKNLLLLIVFLTLGGKLSAQEGPDVIKIRKAQLLKKASYDETDYKVIAIDKYGNPKPEAITSFELHFELKGKRYMYASPNNKLTGEMLNKLKELKKSKQVWFTKIKGQEADGHIVDLPDFDYIVFPKCKNCTPVKQKN